MKYIFLIFGILYINSANCQIAENNLDIIPINKKIININKTCDLNTPLNASIQYNYAVAKGQNSKIREISSPAIQPLISNIDDKKKEKVDYSDSSILNSTIVEIINYQDSVACIIRRENNDYLIHYLTCQNNSWLNEGEDFGGTDIDKLQENIIKNRMPFFLNRLRKINRLNSVSTDTVSFVDYLKQSGMPPKEFVLKQLSKHKLVIYGEIHGRQSSWNLMQEIITSPEFSKHTGTVFLELSVYCQDSLNYFFRNKEKDPEIILDILRKEGLIGWNDKGMYEFILTLWDINNKLPSDKKIRVIASDSPNPFYNSNISKADFANYNRVTLYYRNNYMADTIERYIRTSQDKRNCLFIVGSAHANKSQADALGSYPGNPDKRTCAAILTSKLPANSTYSIFTHAPKIYNGPIPGLIRKGLFDYIFTQNGNRPVAFSLHDSPFGKEPFDATYESFDIKMGNYEDCYDGYIFLQPLKDEESRYWLPEIFSNNFIKELKRRAFIVGEDDYTIFGIKLKEIEKEHLLKNIQKNTLKKPKRWPDFLFQKDKEGIIVVR